MSKKYTLSDIRRAAADVERVMAAIPEQCEIMRRELFRIQEEGEMSGTLSAVRPYAEIEADEENVREMIRNLKRKYALAERRLRELRDEEHELEVALARAKAAAKREQAARSERKARVSG